MKHWLIPETGHFYKANLHTHTTCSDGCKTPEEIKEIYKEHGYSVVAFTDHDIMINHSDLNDENFLAITSHEVETDGPDIGAATATYHLNFYAPVPNCTDYVCPNPNYAWGNARAIAETQEHYKGNYPRIYSVEGQNEMIEEARAKGYLVSYNHPDWSVHSYPDYIGLTGITAVEVRNTECVLGGWVLDEGDHVLNDFLKAGKRVYPIATDDCHSNHDMYGSWVCLKAPALTYDSIMTAYANGDFYASWGPAIDSLYMEDGILMMTFPADSHVVSVSVHTSLCWARRCAGENLTYAEFDLNGYFNEMHRINYPLDRAFFRVMITDNHGNRAMTRGYFLDELE